VATAAVSAGVKSNELPDLKPMFVRAAQTVGTPEYGVLRPVQGRASRFSPRQALDLLWPRVKALLSRTDGPGAAAGRSVPPENWPLVIGLVARDFVKLTKDTLDPRIGLALMMESAIVMSKVDPKTVLQTAAEKK
jgi:hypothetical protein